MEANTMEALLGTTGSVVTEMFELIGTVASTIVETPILMLGVGIFVAGAGIGLFRRILSAA